MPDTTTQNPCAWCRWSGEPVPLDPALYEIVGGKHDGQIICDGCATIPPMPGPDDTPQEIAAYPGHPWQGVKRIQLTRIVR